jgi:hypothetical protein
MDAALYEERNHTLVWFCNDTLVSVLPDVRVSRPRARDKSWVDFLRGRSGYKFISNFDEFAGLLLGLNKIDSTK